MFAILSAIAGFIANICKYLAILVFFVLFIGFIGWAVPLFLDYIAIFPTYFKGILILLLSIVIVKVVINR